MRQATARSSSRGGVTILEIMIGTVILVMALLPLFGLSIQHTRGVGISIDEIDATSYATSLMEALQMVPVSALVPVEQEGGVPLRDLPASVLDELKIPGTDQLRIPEDSSGRFRLSVQILAAEAEAGSDLSSLPGALSSRFQERLGMWVLEVYCDFETRKLQGDARRDRSRQIKLLSLVSGAARGF